MDHSRSGADVVLPAEWIAVFDNDGTLWCEDEAKAKGWTVVDMKQDWKKIFAFEP